MTNDKFSVGDDLYVRDPARHFPCAECIVGPVKAAHPDGTYTIAAAIGFGRMGRAYPNQYMDLTFAEGDLDWRRGTPISALSGRPGHRGFAEFSRIAASWGYD